jgi:hypothetical protein
MLLSLPRGVFLSGLVFRDQFGGAGVILLVGGFICKHPIREEESPLKRRAPWLRRPTPRRSRRPVRMPLRVEQLEVRNSLSTSTFRQAR